MAEDDDRKDTEEIVCAKVGRIRASMPDYERYERVAVFTPYPVVTRNRWQNA